MKLDKTSAKVLAELIISDVRQYVAAHPEEYAAFLANMEQPKKDALEKKRLPKNLKHSA